MSNYRSDQFINLIRNMDARKNNEEDLILLDENTLVELFHPLSEKLTLTDSTDVSYYVLADMVWGNGNVTATVSSSWGTLTNVAL